MDNKDVDTLYARIFELEKRLADLEWRVSSLYTPTVMTGCVSATIPMTLLTNIEVGGHGYGAVGANQSIYTVPASARG